ncbi:hypothetical protein SF83666_a46590 (plasmid) [Sinorhizobium fredii CCBAU 83666]|nr:hypothetical protein SF83666_a46590 [Sinorhizobium fredii CCBAU 83666]
MPPHVKALLVKSQFTLPIANAYRGISKRMLTDFATTRVRRA